jgi:hypothetical protein
LLLELLLRGGPQAVVVLASLVVELRRLASERRLHALLGRIVALGEHERDAAHHLADSAWCRPSSRLVAVVPAEVPHVVACPEARGFGGLALPACRFFEMSSHPAPRLLVHVGGVALSVGHPLVDLLAVPAVLC